MYIQPLKPRSWKNRTIISSPGVDWPAVSWRSDCRRPMPVSGSWYWRPGVPITITSSSGCRRVSCASSVPCTIGSTNPAVKRPATDETSSYNVERYVVDGVGWLVGWLTGLTGLTKWGSLGCLLLIVTHERRSTESYPAFDFFYKTGPGRIFVHQCVSAPSRIRQGLRRLECTRLVGGRCVAIFHIGPKR